MPLALVVVLVACALILLFASAENSDIGNHEKQGELDDEESSDAEVWAQSILQACQEQQQQQQQQPSTPTRSLHDCVQQGLAGAIAATRDDISYFRHVRQRQGNQWEDFACEDNSLETSEPVEETIWYHRRTTTTEEEGDEEDNVVDDNDLYHVQVLHDYASSQIHVLENFIDPDECAGVLEASEAYLHRAKVHDGKGGDHYSQHRKAWQAGIEVDWEQEDALDVRGSTNNNNNTMDHLIAKVSRRVYDYTNHVLDLDISHEGQEHLMSIQYFGDPEDEGPPDRYAPHCTYTRVR